MQSIDKSIRKVVLSLFGVLAICGCFITITPQQIDELFKDQPTQITTNTPVPVVTNTVHNHPPTESNTNNLFATAKMWTTDQSVSQWVEGDTLTVTHVGNKVRFTLGHPERWTSRNGVVACVGAMVYRNGMWHWGPADYLRTANYVKNYGDAAVMPNGDEQKYVPFKGERFYWVVVGLCRHGKVMEPKIRTNIVPEVGR